MSDDGEIVDIYCCILLYRCPLSFLPESSIAFPPSLATCLVAIQRNYCIPIDTTPKPPMTVDMQH